MKRPFFIPADHGKLAGFDRFPMFFHILQTTIHSQRTTREEEKMKNQDLVYIARQLRDDLYSARRAYARACAHKDIFQALALVDRARKKAVLRAVKATLPHLRGKSSNGAMYARASLLAAARTGLPQFIPDWVRHADRPSAKKG